MQTITDIDGLRMKHILPTEHIVAGCVRCSRIAAFHTETLKRGFLPSWPVWWLEDALTVYCEAKKTGEGPCLREFVTGDYGVGD